MVSLRDAFLSLPHTKVFPVALVYTVYAAGIGPVDVLECFLKRHVTRQASTCLGANYERMMPREVYGRWVVDLPTFRMT